MAQYSFRQMANKRIGDHSLNTIRRPDITGVRTISAERQTSPKIDLRGSYMYVCRPLQTELKLTLASTSAPSTCVRAELRAGRLRGRQDVNLNNQVDKTSARCLRGRMKETACLVQRPLTSEGDREYREVRFPGKTTIIGRLLFANHGSESR